ncbi:MULTISPECIES: CDP-glycerol glycerophosphotransferase family protein [unclassified Citrobacter]|uniref:CDP-glycerol glycerophosphotransferase family protein n=1 Tax=unclassified Citrobacter TaxID=2644389 RepID=UPI002574F5B2|nr:MULTISPECIES: CDP-glycerol glycerophosphotransferase family protein [unclassified Citrobacter]MDM2796130.1 CDP-glycerol glycerophosphotransferase family protein [Citrobacter sp. Cpo131]MDM2889475.1 CDP-glycerol glycerophosphotransferase family protein [Citrobacter sp. Cpo060]
MNIKKLKKLVRDPKKFLVDSKFFNKNMPYTFVSNDNPSIGFIIIANNDQYINDSVESLNIANKVSGLTSPYVIINSSENVNVTDKIHSAASKINTYYVKILEQGELIHKDFLKNYHRHKLITQSADIVLHGYTNDLSVTQLDPLIANLKSSANKENSTSKVYFLPSLAVMFFKTEYIYEVREFCKPDAEESKIFNALKIAGLCVFDTDIQFIPNAFSCSNARSRLEFELQEIVKNGDALNILLLEIQGLLKNKDLSLQQSKSLFCLIHNFVLLLLKNKKADELITRELQADIKDYLTEIVNLLGVNVVKTFSANNYNHVHKIGYLKLLGLDAERDICYIEGVNLSNKSIKFKIASHNATLPRLFLNGKETIPLSAKVRALTIFDLSFSFEIYFWISYISTAQELSVHNEFITGILVSGKRLSKALIDNIIKSYIFKDSRTDVLTRKSKILRSIATSSSVKNRFENSWLFIDNELRADDNAEHFYRYVSKYHPNEKIYFLISKNSPDWQRLKNDGFNLIKFGGLTHRLALLNARYLLSSHANPAIVNYLPRKHYSDIMNYKFVFLQHGITKDDQSEWLNSRKIDYLVTAAQHEFNDISGHGRYRFTSQETILTGFPRYDNLKKYADSKKKILIMPTWRKGLAGELIKKSSKRIKNPEFINSLFCEMWGGFLRSEHLRKSAENNGYSIIFLPHPNLTDYLAELTIPDYIKVGDLTSCSIQEIFKDADLLITDYSSVAFDVAYMKKPVIYFQFDSDTFFSEHSYSKGYYDYEELGFGPVVRDIDRLNTELKSILENDAKLTPFYDERIKSFFPYDDHENSLRLYNRLKNESIKNYDHATILEYIEVYIDNIELKSIDEILSRFEINLIKTPPYLHKKLLKVLGDIVFVSKLDNNTNVLSKVEIIHQAISFNESSDLLFTEKLLVATDVEQLLSYTKDYLLKITERESFTNGHDFNLYNYCHALNEFLSFYNEQDYQRALATYNIKLSNYAKVQPRNILLLSGLTLIRNGEIPKAINIFSSLALTSMEKEYILVEIYKNHQPVDRGDLELSQLLPISENSVMAIEAFLLLSKNIPMDLLCHYDDKHVMPDSILIHYLDRMFRERDFARMGVFLNDEFNKKCYLISDANRAKYLFTVFISSGIERFLSELLVITGNDNLVYSLETLFINNDDIDLDVLFKIIESVISKDLYPFSCAEIYQYALFFFKKTRPGLAKKLTTLSIMKKHEEFYSDGRNWNGDDDYRTLLTAVAELNGAMEGLNRIA